MARLAKLNPKVCDLSLALEEFLLARQADGLAQRTLDDYRYHVETFHKANANLTTYEALQKAVIRYFSQQILEQLAGQLAEGGAGGLVPRGYRRFSRSRRPG